MGYSLSASNIATGLGVAAAGLGTTSVCGTYGLYYGFGGSLSLCSNGVTLALGVGIGVGVSAGVNQGFDNVPQTSWGSQVNYSVGGCAGVTTNSHGQLNGVTAGTGAKGDLDASITYTFPLIQQGVSDAEEQALRQAQGL